MDSPQYCEICEREATFICGDCQSVKYCSNEHRIQHWKVHKEPCKVIKQERTRQLEDSVNRNRLQIRRRYFQHYNHKIYDQCIVIASELFDLQRSHIAVTKEIFNEFQYGIAVCLLSRTYLQVGRQLEAKQEMDNYILERLHFLEDMRHIPPMRNNDSYTNKAKLFLERKLSLISAVANIYHQLNQNCIKYYQIYTDHIELVFGSDSYELSNAYFCVGNYYRQINEATKAIACFVKAATIRGKKAGGDCYVNISLLYRQQGRTFAAIDMMMTAIKLNEEEYGPSSRQVGEVYEKLGMLYLDVPDYNNAILHLENALKIFINQKESDDYDRIKMKIQIIYSKMKVILEDENNQKKNKKQKEQQDQLRKRQSLILQRQQNIPDLEKIFKVTENLLSKLTPIELFRLSQLQIQLEKCRSEFAIATIVGNSEFFKKLSDNRKRQLRNQNEKLFELISIEMKVKENNDEN